MNMLVSSNTTDNQPIKCALTKIEEGFDFYPEQTTYQQYTGILKNYVYNPQKRLIA